MKKLYFIAVFFISLVAQSQIVTFSDPIFKARLVQANWNNYTAMDAFGSNLKIDANSNGEIEQSEAAQVYSLYVNSVGQDKIHNLTGLEAFVNLRELDCSNNYLSTLDATPLVHLQKLSCVVSQLSVLNVAGLAELQILSVAGNNLSTLNLAGLPALKELFCQGNLLYTLDVSTLLTLQKLACGQNHLTALNVAPLVNLTELSCDGNNISSLNVAPLTNLTYLEVSNNALASLAVSTLVNLITLGCDYNDLSAIDVSALAQLQAFHCGNNELYNLDVSQNTQLHSLICDNNWLSTLDISALPHLEELGCGYNLLTALDFSSCPLLKALYCQNNDFTSLNLDGLPALIRLDCGNAQLANVNYSNHPQLSAFFYHGGAQTDLVLSGLPSLEFFSAVNTNLTSLDLSACGALKTLNLTYNAALATLKIKTGTPFMANEGAYFEQNNALAYICANEADIAALQAAVGDAEVQINSYCNFTPGGPYNTVAGAAHFSSSGSCLASDPVFDNVGIAITDGAVSGSTFTYSGGSYSYFVQQPHITIAPFLENPSFFTVSPANAVYNFPANNGTVHQQNFCIAPVGLHPDLEVVLLPLGPARPGFDAQYKLIYKNKGNQSQSGNVVLAFDDSVFDFVSASAAAAVTSGHLSWAFTGLLPFDKKEILITLNLNSPLEVPDVNAGDILAFTATLTNDAAEATPLDNIFEYKQTVVNSMDPNDKTCLEGNALEPSMVGKYVHYLIRFENTGTYPAQNIVVKDVIDAAKFDISSLVPLDGSHPYKTRITGNKVEFIFENINLPFDNANNDGYVAFKIKTLPTLVTGNAFSNTAAIYFDYNAPIVTNTATTTVQVLANPDFAFEDYFALYPNPAGSVLNIQSKAGATVSSVTVYNTLGQLVLAIPNAANLKTIDVSALSSGTYYLKLQSDRGSASAKFLKR